MQQCQSETLLIINFRPTWTEHLLPPNYYFFVFYLSDFLQIKSMHNCF